MNTPHTIESRVEERVEQYAVSYKGILPDEVIERSKEYWRKELLDVAKFAEEQGKREEREKYQETNIKQLVEEMLQDIQEHGDMHGEYCPVNMEDPDECDCEEMAFWGGVIKEWMGKVNQMWVAHLDAHRKHCSTQGNRHLTIVKDKITGSKLSRKTLKDK